MSRNRKKLANRDIELRFVQYLSQPHSSEFGVRVTVSKVVVSLVYTSKTGLYTTGIEGLASILNALLPLKQRNKPVT